MPGAIGTPVGTAPAPSAPVVPIAAPIVDDGIAAEHEARLAALEREAFAKGYAQGERAGAEAGGKRGEAMLRRLAQTLEELGGLRRRSSSRPSGRWCSWRSRIARRVVHREVSLDPELARRDGARRARAARRRRRR